LHPESGSGRISGILDRHGGSDLIGADNRVSMNLISSEGILAALAVELTIGDLSINKLSNHIDNHLAGQLVSPDRCGRPALWVLDTLRLQQASAPTRRPFQKQGSL
jgi:hypothetical protein